MSSINPDIKSLLDEIKILRAENLQLKTSSSYQNLLKYKDLLEFVPELIFEMDLNGQITYVNKAGLDKFEYSEQEFTENFNLKSFFPDDYELLSVNISKLLNNEPFEKKTYWAQSKSGLKFPVIVSASVVKENNIALAIRGVLVDLSEQKELEERFRNLFVSSPFPILIFDPNSGEILMSNPKSRTLFDMDYNQLISKNIFFFVNDSGEITFRNFIKNIDTEDKDIYYNTTITKETGENRDVKITLSSICIKGKDYIQSIFQDISNSIKKEKIEIEQRKQKELLALSVFQLNQYQDLNQVFKYIANTLSAFNPKSIVAVFNYLPESNKLKINTLAGDKVNKMIEILGPGIQDFEFDKIEYDRPQNKFFIDIEKLFNDKNIYSKISSEKFELLKQELEVKKLYTASLIVNNKFHGSIGILTPNENFLAENEFIEIFISQAGIILDRISHEKELIEAKERAIESDRLKSAFLSNMSHEIRTPMNSILGFSNLILSEDIEENLKSKYATLIQSSGDILVKLIDDIIDISKIESNQLQINKENFIVNHLIEELEVEFNSLNINNTDHVKMVFDYKGPEVVIKSDINRIKQILSNLISNSRKFTSEGTINVWYHLEGDQISFFVKDTGIGIPKDKQNIIFDRFRQADETSVRPYRGAGLGLSISKHLAHLLGGDILFNSQRYVGTEFILKLPTNKENVQKINKTYIKPFQTIDIDWSHFLIFIAEDEESNFDLLEAFLRKTKVKFEWFKNGQELITAIKKTKPDLILLDLKMPILDGYAAASKIKNKYKDIPIIAQTAYAMSDEKRRAIEVGCDDFISKPIKKEVLYFKMSKFLK